MYFSFTDNIAELYMNYMFFFKEPVPLGDVYAGNHGICIHHAHDIFETSRTHLIDRIDPLHKWRLDLNNNT